MVESPTPEQGSLGLNPGSLQISDVWSWVSYLTSLCLNFPFCKMRRRKEGYPCHRGVVGIKYTLSLELCVVYGSHSVNVKLLLLLLLLL